MSNFIPSQKFIQKQDDGSFSLNIMIDGMHCPSCVALIEKTLHKQENIISARINLTQKKLKIFWQGDINLGDKFLEIINNMGYRAIAFNPETAETFEKQQEKFLLKCLAVAGFASGNLMLFSIPMWTANDIQMGEITRSFFHWIQLLIAVPAIIYSGMPFYKSAFLALKERHTNMDVPISVAVILTTLLSIFQVFTHGHHAYLDSSIMLLFFLLIGRYLDAQARGKARGAAHDLLQMMTGSATIIDKNGKTEIIPLSDVKEDMVLLVASGEKIAADGEVIEGNSELDTSIITGETIPQKITIGSKIFAGTINISSPLKVLVTKAGQRSLLSEIITLMENAEQGQAKYVSIADRISRWYTPIVHILAALTFIFWWLFMGIAWQSSLLIAATVLIITCPCALGLAVPVVQVLASSKLMQNGILIKSGSALERLAEVTTVIFDKTGTLTLGKPQIQNKDSLSNIEIQIAASLAIKSKHPLSIAITNSFSGVLLNLDAKEIAGCGIEGFYNNHKVKLGNRSWCNVNSDINDDSLELWLNYDNKHVRFMFADELRVDASEVIQQIKHLGLNIKLLSGDRLQVVSSVGKELNINDFQALLSPIDKCKVIEQLKLHGDKILMIGDGLNDAPSLASANVSMSPSSAMDITQNSADIVFQGSLLKPVITAITTAHFSQTLVKQNFALAIIYNIIAIPMAIMGYVTPLVAAIAMSSSSIIVIVNAMRLKIRKKSYLKE